MVNTRLYVQLQPDEAGREALAGVQQTLPSQSTGRLIGKAELHLTLIHFGVANDVYQSVSHMSGVDRNAFSEALAAYVTEAEAWLPKNDVTLQHTGFELYGAKKNALAATFKATDELREQHAKQLDVLRRFFKRMDLTNPDEFMQSDPNFQHALTLNPHVTLYKGFSGELPNIEIGDIAFSSMNVVY